MIYRLRSESPWKIKLSLIKGDETIYTGRRNLFWMYGHSRAELIYIPLVSGQKRDGNFIQSHSKFKIIADTYQMATLILFEDYSKDYFSKSFLASQLKVDYSQLDSLVLSHLEKLKLIKIQAWIHHWPYHSGSPGRSIWSM